MGSSCCSRAATTANTRTAGRRGVFGRGWAHTFEQVLFFTADPEILAIRVGNGLPFYYEDTDHDGVFRATMPATEKSRVEVVGGVGYVRHYVNGRRETFDSNGRWVSESDAAGNTTTLERDAAARLIKVTDPSGRSLQFEYTGDVVTRVTGPAGVGELAQYAYTSAGLLSDVTYPDGSGFQYTYDNVGQILDVRDRAGNVVERHAYEGKKGTLSEVAGGQEKLTFEYGEFFTRVTDALGGVKTYEYSPIWGRNHITRITHSTGESEDWTYRRSWPPDQLQERGGDHGGL